MGVVVSLKTWPNNLPSGLGDPPDLGIRASEGITRAITATAVAQIISLLTH